MKSNPKQFVVLASAPTALLAIMMAPTSAASPQSEPRMTICHKEGTPAEMTLTLPYPAAMSHIRAHGDRLGPCGLVDVIIDADGTASTGDGVPGAVNTPLNATLSDFPVLGIADAGLDWFDNDGDGQWTFGLVGDDMHSEDPNTCPTAIRNGIHDLGFDCKVVDMDASLFQGQGVSCDLEVNAAFVPPFTTNGVGCPSSQNNIRYYDANGDLSWDDGEDIILDVNGNFIFD